MAIKISIIDDHPLVITGIKNMLSAYSNIQVIGEYQNYNSLITGFAQQLPDILLLDVQMPDKMGDEIAVAISKNYPSVKLIALTGFDTPFYVRNMIQKGCLGYLIKNTDQSTMLAAIESVYKGEQYIDEELKKVLLDNMLKIKKEKTSFSSDLTRREKEVLRLIVNEYTSQEIADALFLGLRTVEKYRLQLLQKLKVKNTAGLVKAALELNLIEDI